MRSSVLGVAAVLVTLLVGCTSDASESDAGVDHASAGVSIVDPPQPVIGADASVSTTGVEPASGTPDAGDDSEGAGEESESAGDLAQLDPPGPIRQLLDGRPETPDDERVRRTEQDRLVVECMQRLGWEYVPPPAPPTLTYQGETSATPYGSIAWHRLYGYGVATLYGDDGAADDATFELPVADPNQLYLDSLTADERESWNQDLAGSMAAEARTDEGCVSTGKDVSSSDSPGIAIDGLSSRAIALESAIDDDPRMNAALIGWRDCVTADFGPVDIAGVQVTLPRDMVSYMLFRLGSAEGLEYIEFDVASPPEGMARAATPVGDTWIAALGEAKPVADDVLNRLVETEHQLWTIDQKCQADARVRETRIAIEQEIVDVLVGEFPELQDV